MNALFYAIIANLIVSLCSLLGVATLSLKREKLDRSLIYFVALSAGTLMGASFFHLIPEASDSVGIEVTNLTVVMAFITFFLVEKLLHWHHHHAFSHDTHTLGFMNLLGDSLHNFLDGMILAATFYVDPRLGVTATIAVLLHEIPQEIGDFGVLLHSGFSVKKALLFNIGVSLTSVLGAVVGALWLSQVEVMSSYITAFAAGGFLYVSTSDLLPEIRKEDGSSRSWITFIVFLLGMLLMVFL
jgi:zinc and cadmium transporter